MIRIISKICTPPPIDLSYTISSKRIKTDFVTSHSDSDPMSLICSLLITFLSVTLVRPASGEDRLNVGDPVFKTQNQYWIVSSRNCPQDIHQAGCCALRAWKVDCSFSPAETCRPATQNAASLQPVDPDSLRNSLISGFPVCVLVHGSYARWEDVLIESGSTRRWLQSASPEKPLQFISYTWPSEPLTYLPTIDANVLGKRSGINGFHLARMMQMIPADCPVCLIGHSHGTRTISSMLHLLQGGNVEGYCLPAGTDAGHRIRAVFAASAIDHDWLNPGKKYGHAIGRLDGLMNLRNRRDWVLGIYPLRKIGSSRALGRAGWTSRDYNCLGVLSYQLQELDVTALIGKPHIWPAYYQTPSLAEAISSYIHFAEEPPSVGSSPGALRDTRSELVTVR